MQKRKKHERVTEQLRERIHSGRWRASEKLPSQADLALEYGVSLGTIQKCIKALENERLLFSSHGSGTYVTTDSPPSEELLVWRFRDETGRLLPIYSRVETVTRIGEDGPWRRHLGEEELILVTRMISINLHVFTHSYVYLRGSEFQHLLTMPLHRLDGHDLTRIIDRTTGGAEHFTYRIRGRVLSEAVRDLNRLPPDTRGVSWELQAYGIRDRPVWYQVIEAPLSDYAIEIFAQRPPKALQALL